MRSMTTSLAQKIEWRWLTCSADDPGEGSTTRSSTREMIWTAMTELLIAWTTRKARTETMERHLMSWT